MLQQRVPFPCFLVSTPDQGYATHLSTISFGGAFSLSVVRWSIYGFVCFLFFRGGWGVGRRTLRTITSCSHVLLVSHINVLRGSSPDLYMWQQVRWICVFPLSCRTVCSWGGRQRLLMPYLVPYGYGVPEMAPRVKNFQNRPLPWQSEGLLRLKGLSNVAFASSQ